MMFVAPCLAAIMPPLLLFAPANPSVIIFVPNIPIIYPLLITTFFHQPHTLCMVSILALLAVNHNVYVTLHVALLVTLIQHIILLAIAPTAPPSLSRSSSHP